MRGFDFPRLSGVWLAARATLHTNKYGCLLGVHSVLGDSLPPPKKSVRATAARRAHFVRVWNSEHFDYGVTEMLRPRNRDCRASRLGEAARQRGDAIPRRARAFGAKERARARARCAVSRRAGYRRTWCSESRRREPRDVAMRRCTMCGNIPPVVTCLLARRGRPGPQRCIAQHPSQRRSAGGADRREVLHGIASKPGALRREASNGRIVPSRLRQ